MAPVEFEKHIREQLEDRKIEPSSNAWDRISDRLEVKQSSRKPFFFRYAVAAVLAGLLLTSIWIFSDSEQQIDSQQTVVDNPSTEDVQEEKAQMPATDQIDNEAVAVEEQNTTVEDVVVLQEAAQETLTKSFESETLSSFSEDQELASKDHSEMLIEEKVIEVLARVEILEENAVAVTDAEVDSLLRSAQRELMANREFNEQYEVNAADLLAGVEDELNTSFRDQVFEKLKQGFVKVRTAVADRNK